MADIRDIAGFTDRNRVNNWIWIVDGLTPGDSYTFAEPSSDDQFECSTGGNGPMPPCPPPVSESNPDPTVSAWLHPSDDFTTGGLYDGTANADGAYILSQTPLVAGVLGPYIVYTADSPHPGKHNYLYCGGCAVEDPFDPANYRLSGEFTYTINSSTAQDTPYVDAGVLVATPDGPTDADLSWDTATTVISEPGDLVYDVLRSLSPSPSYGNSTLIAAEITSTVFSDSGLTPGTTYYYKVICLFKLDAVPQPVGDDTYQRNRTNVASINTPVTAPTALSLDNITL